MTIFRNKPYLLLLTIWAVIVVSSVCAVLLYNYELTVGMGMGASAVIVALIALPLKAVEIAFKIKGKNNED